MRRRRRREIDRAVAAGADVVYVPADEMEYLSLPRVFNDLALTLLVTGMLCSSVLYTECYNLAFKNFSSRDFCADEWSVIGLCGFSPTPTDSITADQNSVHAAHTDFMRGIYLYDYNREREETPPPDDWWQATPDQVPPRLRVPKPDFHPLQNAATAQNPEGYIPSEGISDFATKTANALRLAVSARPAHVKNLSRAQRQALTRLRADSNLVIAFADKNLGLVADDASNYERHGLNALAATHVKVLIHHAASNVVLITMHAMRTRLDPFMNSLPAWASLWLTAMLSGSHPRTRRAFSVPSFRLLYKIHKSTLGFRPITGNHTWCTQPLALLVAFLLLPFVKLTSTYVPDTDAFQTKLDGLHVGKSHMLVTYDVVNLYPSIPHAACQQLIRDHLCRAGCPYADFIGECLALILTFNYCFFAGDVWQQTLGYATGVACGGECAHLYLEERLAPVFALFAADLLMHVRYIDDGFLIWTGSRQRLDTLIAALRAIDPVNLQFTFEISDHKAIFLDSYIFKGPGWLSSGVLDYECYQKIVNRYLYLPFSTETPRHILSGFIRGELLRYVKRCSYELAFVRMQQIFWARLRARGYTIVFLRDIFAKAPAYCDRARLRAPRAATVAAASRAHCLILRFSAALHQAQLGRVLHEYKYLLPDHLRKNKFIIAYTIPTKVSSFVVPYRFPPLPPQPSTRSSALTVSHAVTGSRII
jgi:hypothetical protein